MRKASPFPYWPAAFLLYTIMSTDWFAPEKVMNRLQAWTSPHNVESQTDSAAFHFQSWEEAGTYHIKETFQKDMQQMSSKTTLQRCSFMIMRSALPRSCRRKSHLISPAFSPDFQLETALRKSMKLVSAVQTLRRKAFRFALVNPIYCIVAHKKKACCGSPPPTIQSHTQTRWHKC